MSGVRWTAHAAAYSVLAPILLIAGARFEAAALAVVGGMLALLLVWDALRVQVAPPNITMQVFGTRVPEGGKIVVRLEGRRLREQHQIHLDLPQALRIAEGTNLWHPSAAQGTHELTLEALVRGPHHVGPLAVRLWSPARLWCRDIAIAPAQEVDVIPRTEDVSQFGLLSRVVKPMPGRFTVNRPGQGFDFFTLRQYNAGDTMRAVNWKASARKDDDLIVNQRQMETHSELMILLDARVVAGIGPTGDAPLDRACRAALGLFSEAVGHRDTVRFLSYGTRVDGLPPGKSDRVATLETVLSRLPAHGMASLSDAWGVAKRDMRSQGPIVVLSSLEADRGAAAAIAEMAGRGHPVTVLSPRPVGPNWERSPERHQARDNQMDAIRERGAMVVDWLPGTPIHAEKPVLRSQIA